MSVHINLLPRKTVRERVWKTLNVVVGITTILNVSMVGSLVAPKAAYADTSAIQYTLEGQRKDASFTPGNICSGGGDCYAEGENVPFRLTITDLTPSTPYSVRIQHDFQDSAGRDGYVNFNTPGTWDGSATGVGLSASTTSAGLPNTKTYDLTFTTASAATVVQLQWFGLLGQDAGEWNGAQLHARLVRGVEQESIGNKEVPIQVTKIVIRNLSVTKTDNPDPIQLNATTTYTIVVTNSGEQDETVTVVDQLPSELVYVNGSGSPAPSSVSGDSRTITWNGIIVTKNGGTRTLTFDARGVEVGTGTNEVTVTAPLLDPVSDTENTTVLGQCELTITKAVNSQTANPGDILTYTLTYQNTGMANCTGGGVRIEDAVPTGVTYNGIHSESVANDGGGSPTGVQFGFQYAAFGLPINTNIQPGATNMSWNANVVVPGESGIVTYQATVNTPAQCGRYNIPNNAKIYADQIPGGVTSNTVNTSVSTACNGRLIIDKVTNPSGDPQVFSFDASGGSYADFTLTDTQAPNDQALVAGTYSVSEAVPAGWDQTSAICSDGSPVNAIVLAADETVTCTFTNTKKGHLIVQKTTAPAADPTVFSISASGTGTITGGGAGTVTDALDKNYEVTPGTYSVTETVPDGWSKTGDTCQGVTVDAGDTKYCTLTNTRDTGWLTVNKMVDPENDGSFVGVGGADTPFRWGVDALDGSTTPRYMGATATGIPTVTPFNVNENLSDVPGHHFAGWYYTNDAAQLDNNRTYNCTTPQFTSMPTGLTVAKNGTTQITLCNARDTGNLTINKYDDDENPLSGVTFTAGSYSGQTDGSGTLVFSNIPTGPYVVTETKPDNYHFSSVSGDCSPNANPTNVTVTTAGEQCTFTNARDMGGLRIIKQVNNDFGGTKGPGDFLINVKQSGIDIPGSPFAGVGGEGQLFPLPTGEYTISEDALPGGYALQSIDCQEDDLWSLDRASFVGVPPTSQTVEIGEGEKITCTVTNQDIQPKLTVTKVVNNTHGGTKTVSNFPLFVGLTSVTSGVQKGFNAGAYTVSETNLPGYIGAISGDCAADGSITLNSGDVKSCTITNDDQQATLTVIKHVINNNGGTVTAGNFTMNVTGTAATASFPGAEIPGTTINVNPGSYYVDESGPSGYTASFDGDCDDSIALGEHKTCTVTNDDIAPTITLNKTVINDNGGNAGVNDFGLTIGGAAVTSGQILPVTANTPIALNEVGKTGYSFVSITGNELCPSALGGTVTLTPGQNISCTITNNDQAAHLTVIKHVINDNGGIKTAGDFTMTISGVTVVGTGTFAGVESPGVTREVAPGVYNITETQLAGYAASFSADCAGTIALGENKTCTITNNDIVSSIGLVKTAAPSVVAAGENITYTLAWSVTGTNPVTNAVITDPIPANTSFVSAANGGTFSAGTVTWNLGTLAGGSSGTVAFIVKAASPIANGTVVTNTGTFDTTETPPVSSTVNTPIQSAPSLSITKTNNVAGFANPGNTVTYTVTVTNAADATDTAHDVVMTDVLPTGFTFVSDGASTKTFSLGDLTPGGSATTSYDALIAGTQAAGTYTNTATAQGSNTSVVTATSNVEVRIPQVLGASSAPTMTLKKTVNTAVVNPGATVTYTVTITNPGDLNLTNVTLSDTLPTGFVFVEGGGRTKTWTIGTLAAGHQRVINYDVRVTDKAAAGIHENIATVRSTELDPQTAKAKVEVRKPRVLGLATTGVTGRDYLIFAVGLGSLVVGLYWSMRLRRRYDGNSA